MLKTEALYYHDRYMKECQAKLLSVEVDQGKVKMIFDKTIFFPGGGGQAQDKGYLIDDSGIRFDIYGLEDREGHIYHEVRPTKEGLEFLMEKMHSQTDCTYHDGEKSILEAYIRGKIGEPFEMVLDWEHREDNMHQHSGEHVL